MKQQFKLNVSPRAQTGRSASRRLRKSNQVPAVLYGKHTAPETLALDGPEFIRLIKAIAGSASLIEIQRKDKPETALTFLQEVQRDPMTDRYVHVDLREVKADETFEIRVKIQLTGESFGVKNQSGVLESSNSGVRIRCQAKDLPGFVEVDVTELKVGETIHIAELKKISGVQFLDDPSQPVVSCVEPVAEVVSAVVAAPTAGEGAPVAGEAAAGAAPAAGAAAPAGDAKAAAPAAGAKGAAPAAGAKPAAPAAGAKPAAPAKK